MGWANCGEDSKGRPIGYAHEATCDAPGCNEKIDRGLSFACGGMHGTDDQYGFGGISCERYFCSKHLKALCFKDNYKEYVLWVCQECYDNFIADSDEEIE